MTAPIVYVNATDIVIPAEDYWHRPQHGRDQALVRDIYLRAGMLGDGAGTLWQRVSEATPVFRVKDGREAARLSRRIHAVYRDSPRHLYNESAALMDPNQRVRMFGIMQRGAAGRIVAGVRVK